MPMMIAHTATAGNDGDAAAVRMMSPATKDVKVE